MTHGWGKRNRIIMPVLVLFFFVFFLTVVEQFVRKCYFLQASPFSPLGSHFAVGELIIP